MRKSMPQMIDAVIEKAGLQDNETTRKMVKSYIQDYARAMPGVPDDAVIYGVVVGLSPF